MPIFELRTISGRRVAFVPADNIESIFSDVKGDRLILVTIDGKEYKFDHLEIHMCRALDEPEYII